MKASVYWIRLSEHSDKSVDGYIGVSKNVDDRSRQHYEDIRDGLHKNIHLSRAVNKYGWDNLIIETIHTGDEQECYKMEEALRPEKNIGWNIAPGGHRGPGWPKGRKRSKEWLEQLAAKRLPAKLEKERLANEEKERKLLARQKKKLDAEEAKQKRQIDREIRRAAKTAADEAKREKAALRMKKAKLFTDLVQNRMERKVCPVCNVRPVAHNYTDKNGVLHYRRVCDVCKRAGKKHKEIPAWYKSGYRKKPQCEKCGFKFKFAEQSSVFYVDGNLRNNNHFNLKTVCLNCCQEVYRSRLSWKQSPLTPDF